ncbi:MAG: glycosyltransferase [Gaiellaceae bacterium]
MAERRLRVLATVTFNENQLRAHLLPILALDEVEEVVLVTDNPPPALPKLRAVVPPRALVRIFGRAGAKLIVCIRVARRERPDWVIGFNLVPHGLNAIATARAAGARSLYVMIGGDREWLEGGWSSDNGVLGRLRRPAPRLERLLLRAIRRATYVATMGSKGQRALVARGVEPEHIVTITPAVDVERFAPGPEDRTRTYDVITVGALLPNKRTADLVRVAARLVRNHPKLRVAIAGAGPLESELRSLAADLGVDGVVEFLGFRADIDALYSDARIFVLLSASEGLSIAMLEAMTSGLPPVVTEVGELGDFIRDGETGRLFVPGDVDALAEILDGLLRDRELRASMGRAAAADVPSRVAVDAVAGAYRTLFSVSREPERA